MYFLFLTIGKAVGLLLGYCLAKAKQVIVSFLKWTHNIIYAELTSGNVFIALLWVYLYCACVSVVKVLSKFTFKPPRHVFVSSPCRRAKGNTCAAWQPSNLSRENNLYSHVFLSHNCTLWSPIRQTVALLHTFWNICVLTLTVQSDNPPSPPCQLPSFLPQQPLTPLPIASFLTAEPLAGTAVSLFAHWLLAGPWFWCAERVLGLCCPDDTGGKS